MSDVGGGEARFEVIIDLGQAVQAGEQLGDAFVKGTNRAKRSVAGLDEAVAKAGAGVSRAAHNLGRATGLGMAKGIASSAPSVQRAALGVVQQAIRAQSAAQTAAARAQVANQKTAAQAAAQAVRGQQQASTQANRAALAAQNQAARQAAQQAINLGKLQATASQTAGQLAVTAARTSGQQRVAITRFTLDSIARLEKGLGRVIEGTASTLVSATRRVFAGTVGSIQRSFAERRSIITRNLNSEVHLFQHQAAQVQRIQQQSRTGLLGSLRGGALAGAVGGGLGIGALGNLGFQRAADIENIQKRLKVLIGDAAAATALFGELRDFAKTTAFDLTGVSDLASRLLAAKVASADILPNIKALAGAITLVGGTTDDLNGIARALGQIVSVGKLTAEEMNQISERLPGLNITQLFSDALGFDTTAAFIKAREAGEITGEVAVAAFFNAVKGDPRFTEALAAGADSFSNLRANALESFADIGAAFFERFEGPIKAGLKSTIKAFAGIASFIRGTGLSDSMEVLRLALGKVVVALAGLAAAKGAVEVFSLLGRGIGLMLNPLGLVVTAVTAATAAFLFFFQRSERFREIVLDVRDRAVELGRALRDQVEARVIALADRLAPLADKLAAVGKRLFEIGRAFRQALATGGLGFALENLRKNLKAVADDAFAAIEERVPGVRKVVDVIKRLGAVVQSFRADGFIAGLKDLGSAIADGVGNITSRLDTSLKKGLAGAGVGALAGGLIGGPLGAAIGAALGAGIALAIPRLRAAIAGINPVQLFGKFLEGVRVVGQRIAQFLFDKKTLIAAAGFIAGAVAIGVQFVSGFISGFISKLGDVADVGALLLNTLFAQNSMVKAIAALAILFRRQLAGLIVPIFRKAGEDGGKAAVEGAAVGAQSRLAVFGQTLKSGLANAGRVAASGLATALAAGLAGSALGGASSNLEKGLGIAGIAGSAAQAFALGGGQVTGAALAAGTVGVGLLTAAFAANAKRAAEARARVDEYVTAVEAAGESSKSVAVAISGVFTGNLKQASDEVKRGFVAAGQSAQDLQAQIASGKGASIIEALRESLRRLEGASFSSVEGLRTAQGQYRDIGAAIDFVNGELKALKSTSQAVDLNKSLFGDGAGAIKTAGAAIQELVRKTLAAAAAQKRLGEKLRTDRAKAGIDSLKTGMDNLKASAKDARQAIIDSLNVSVPQLPAAQAATTVAVSDLGAQAGELDLGSKLGGAKFTGLKEDFRNQLNELVAAAATEANPGQALANALTGVQSDIANSGLSAEIQAGFNEIVGQVQGSINPVKIEALALANLQVAAAAGDQVAAAALAAAGRFGPIAIKAKADAVAAGVVGEQIFTSADVAARGMGEILPKVGANVAAAATAGKTIFTSAKASATSSEIKISKITGDVNAASRAGSSIARNVLSGFAAGFKSATSTVTKVVSTVLNGVTTTANAIFRISSPSKVFMGIGEEVMKGLALGIREGGADAVSAIESVATALIGSTKGAFLGVRAGLSTLFDETFSEFAVLGGGNSQTAVGGFTTALRGIISQVTSNAEALWAAAIKPANERNFAERLLLGESFVSLRAGDEFGVANRAAISGAVDAIKSIGDALLEQGFSAEQAAQHLTNYRAQLLATAVQAGLSAAEVDGLIDSFGLSAASLQQFIARAQQLNQIVAEGQRRAATPTAPPLTTGPNPTQQFITNNLYLPTGDPQANALAVVNRLALAVR